MWHDATIAGDWRDLVATLDGRNALGVWARQEPALSEFSSLDDLAAATKYGQCPARADEIIGALLRVGSRQGGDDPDAVLVLLHLLSDGIRHHAAILQDLSPDVVALLAGEVAVAARGFGVGPRGGRCCRAYAANLLRVAHRRVLRELRPRLGGQAGAELLVDPVDVAFVARTFDVQQDSTELDDELELADVLEWAERSGVARPEDLSVLVAAELSRERIASEGQARIAARFGIDPCTLRRRRDRALAALQAARDDFVAWTAA